MSLLDINNLTFNNQRINIVLDTNNEPWFRAKDVITILEYANLDKAYKHIDHEDRITFDTERNNIYINESGLYSLIMFSKMRDVKHFQKWLTKDVLPSLRRTDKYRLQTKIDSLTEDFERNFSLKLKQLTINKIFIPLEYDQYIYIASTEFYKKQNYFKVGGTKTKIENRLSTYNTGRADEDPYIFLYIKSCNNYKVIEDRLNSSLNFFKPNNKKEMFNILFEDLKTLIDMLVNDEKVYIEYINANYLNIFNNLLYEDKKSIDVIPEHINLEHVPFSFQDFVKNKVIIVRNKRIRFKIFYNIYFRICSNK